MKYFIFLLLILSLNLNAQNTDYKIINANVFITYIDTTNTCNTLVLNSTDWKFIKYLDKDFWTIKLKLTNKNKVFSTYELCGEKIGNNKEKITGHKLIKHGSVIFDIDSLNYDYLKNLFSNPNIDIEGFVIYHPTDDRMCKIRKSDFGIER